MNAKHFALAAVAALALSQSIATAQITMDIDANVPFAFVVGDTTLTAGKYVVKAMTNSEGEIEIVSASGHPAVMLSVESSQAKEEPKQTELIFNRYGNREFLSQIFIEGNTIGVELVPSKLEKELMAKGEKPVKHSHPAMHRGKKMKKAS